MARRRGDFRGPPASGTQRPPALGNHGGHSPGCGLHCAAGTYLYRPLVHQRVNTDRRHGAPLAVRAIVSGPVVARQAVGFLRRAIGDAGRHAAGAGAESPAPVGHPARLQDGGYLRRRIRGRNALLLQHLRPRERSRAFAGTESHRDRQRAHQDRAGNRVRLLQRPCRPGPFPERCPQHNDQLQPRNRVNGLRL